MKGLLKTFTLFLLAFVTVALACGCSGTISSDVNMKDSATQSAETTEAPDATEAPDVTEAPTEPEKTKREISKEALAEYTVIASLTEGYLYNNAISKIYQGISEKYGITVKMSDDFLMGDAQPSGKEIIIGKADRDFVTEESLPYDGYHIYMSGDNIVLSGGSPEAVADAADFFLSLFEDEGISLNEEGYIKETEYPLGNLKINGTHIGQYKIVVKEKTFGANYAAEHLQKTLRELTGFELKITASKSEAAFCIDSTNAEDGQYHIEADGTNITLYGAGLNGDYIAVKAMLEMIGENEDATIESCSAPMLLLNNTKKKLEEGTLSIGYMGDSIMAAAGGFKSYTVFLTEYFRAAYPDADIKMLNHSVGGKNTTWGLYTMEKSVLSAGYDDLIFISLGTNDNPYGNDYEQIAINYQSMIEKIYKHNPDTDIVFVSHGYSSVTQNLMKGKAENFINAMLNIANYYGIPVIDNFYTMYDLCKDNWDETWSYYISDGVHPNTTGQELYANTVWKSVSVALENSDASRYAPHTMPEEPIYERSKVDATEYAWSSFVNEVTFGTGDEAGWGKDGTVTKSGASISFDFEGFGLELGIKHNKTNPYFLLIQIYDEQGELVLEQERDSGYYYHLFITDDLEYGKYTVKLTVTKPSERYPSEGGQTFTLTDKKIIK